VLPRIDQFRIGERARLYWKECKRGMDWPAEAAWLLGIVTVFTLVSWSYPKG
jgi:hypothetical protein